MNDRHKFILKLLSKKNEASVKELSSSLKVSSVTIRQDLTELEKVGLIKRVHGGAVLETSDKISNRLAYNYEEKIKIAKKAAEFVNDGETVFIESGSVNTLLARELSSKNDITVLTSNIFIAREIKQYKNLNIIIMGGIYQHISETLVGQLTNQCIQQFNFDKAFIGVDGFTIDTGFTSRDMLRAETASNIIKRCGTSFVLTDSSKFGRIALTKMFETNRINKIITNSIPTPEKEYLEKNNVKVVIAL